MKTSKTPRAGGTVGTSYFLVALACASLGVACSAGSSNGPPTGSSGAPNSGGNGTQSGGATSNGGSTGTGNGGGVTSGGTANVGGGGTANVGGGGTTGGTVVFDGGTDPNRNNVTGGNVCDRLSTLQCSGEAACCASPGRTFDQCKQTMKDGCVNQLYLDAITGNPVSGFDAGRAASAFGQFELRAKSCDPSVASWAASVDGLRGITQGTIQPGGTCTPPDLANKQDDAAYLASCADPGNQACLPAAVPPWKCTPRAQAGGSCFTDVNCVDGLYCDNPKLALPLPIAGPTCKQRLAPGSPCTLPNECASLACRNSQCAAQDQQGAYCLNNG